LPVEEPAGERVVFPYHVAGPGSGRCEAHLHARAVELEPVWPEHRGSTASVLAAIASATSFCIATSASAGLGDPAPSRYRPGTPERAASPKLDCCSWPALHGKTAQSLIVPPTGTKVQRPDLRKRSTLGLPYVRELPNIGQSLASMRRKSSSLTPVSMSALICTDIRSPMHGGQLAAGVDADVAVDGRPREASTTSSASNSAQRAGRVARRNLPSGLPQIPA
jgi:hypothetical protein